MIELEHLNLSPRQPKVEREEHSWRIGASVALFGVVTALAASIGFVEMISSPDNHPGVTSACPSTPTTESLNPSEC